MKSIEAEPGPVKTANKSALPDRPAATVALAKVNLKL